MKLIKGLPDKKLLNRMCRYNRLNGIYERGLGYYLLDFDQRRLYQTLGFASTVQFALARLHLHRKKTLDLLRIARSLEDLPRIDLALSRGRISWSAVREISRVAVKETEDEWLEFALSASLRKIEQAVSRARRGERPPRDAYGVCATKVKMTVELPVEDYAVFKAAFDRVVESAGSELDFSGAVYLMAKSYLERPAADDEREYRRPFQVVYQRCTECERAWIQTSDGAEGVPAQKVDARAEEAEVIHLDSPCFAPANGKARVNGNARAPVNENAPALATVSKAATALAEPPFSAFTASPHGDGPLDGPTSTTLRRKVLSRDGHCCAVPGCMHRADLNAHHVIWRENGGFTHALNEVTVCRRCHTLIHEGFLKVSGSAPHGLTWLVWDGRPVDEYMVEGDESDRKSKQLAYEKQGLRASPRGDGWDAFEDTTITSLEEIPDDIDSAWWRKHGHNFIFKGKRLVLAPANPGRGPALPG